jgi:2-dehydropantoate 2-reductase
MGADVAFRYVICGAGAVGGAVGGLLLESGSRVLFVARPAQAEAISRGFQIELEGRSILVRGQAVTSARQIEPRPEDFIMLSVKSQGAAIAIEELTQVYGEATPIACLQNGVRNEEVAARRFARVYAGVVLFSAIQLDPNLITITRGRQIIVGSYPEGLDATVEQLRKDLARAGFDCLASPHAMAIKWDKLIANLNNATHAITGLSLEESHSDPQMRLLMAEVCQEGARVLEAAGLKFDPPDSPLRIRDRIESLRRPPEGPQHETPRSFPSMWQDLYLGRPSTEIEFLNGEIVKLGQRLGIQTPYNSALVEIVTEMSRRGLKPGLYTPAQLGALIEGHKIGRGSI